MVWHYLPRERTQGPVFTLQLLGCAGGKLPLKVVVQRGIDICRGLQDLHEAGITMQTLHQVSPQLNSCRLGNTSMIDSRVYACTLIRMVALVHNHQALDLQLLGGLKHSSVSHCHGQNMCLLRGMFSSPAAAQRCWQTLGLHRVTRAVGRAKTSQCTSKSYSPAS